MYPILFKIGNLAIYTYGTILYIDLILSYLLLNKLAPKFGINKDKLFYTFIIVLFSMYLGGKMGYNIFNEKFNNFLQFIISILNPWASGLTILGAIVFSIIGLLISSRLLEINFFKLSDLYGFIAPLSISIGRIGCLFAGCCYGKESNWGIFLHGAIRYPTQLMESLMSLIVFLYFIFDYNQKNYFSGKYITLFISFYSSIRFIVEFFRESERIFYFLSWAQIFSIIFFLFSTVLFFILKKEREK